MSAFTKILAVLSATLLVVAGGIWLGGHPETLPGPIRDTFVDENRAIEAEITDSIKDNYYKPVKDSAIDENSLKGIVDGLNDRFSHYITPKERARFEESVSGRFEGVGMSVDQDRRGLKLLTVFKGSPAARAGLRKGWYVTAVNGQSIAGVSSSVAVAKIKGPAGTKVTLDVVDPAKPDPKRVRLKRENIEVPVTTAKLVERGGAKIGVVTLSTFSEGAHGAVRRDIDRLLKKGAKGIVFDLRGNGGGLLREAVLVSSVFVDHGLVVYTKGRSRPRRDFEAVGGAIPKRIPVVVLVDGGSASASEIVTGALRDTGRAQIAGTKTFGKGVFQEVQPLSNGGVLDITVGEYFLPKGENIGHKGIVPKIKAKDDPKTARDEALPKALDVLSARARAN
jgi:carboxyl-terminal processing protease